MKERKYIGTGRYAPIAGLYDPQSLATPPRRAVDQNIKLTNSLRSLIHYIL